MDFEETLTALLGMNGCLVEVSIAGVAGDPPLAAVDRGRLERADVLAPERGAADGAESCFFTLGAGTGFFLSRDQFAGAEWTGPRGDLLAARTGSVWILVEPVEEAN